MDAKTQTQEVTVAKVHVEGWDVLADEYLGRDRDNAEYYRVGQDVYRVRRGVVRWLCTTAAWSVYKKAYWSSIT